MTIKTGVHINHANQEAIALLRQARPRLVKTLDMGANWSQLKAECGIETLIGRVYLDTSANLEPTPTLAAERLYLAMLPHMQRHRNTVDYWLAPWNERYQHASQGLAEYAAATRYFCERAHGDGFKVGVGNFSVAYYIPDEIVTVFAPALEVADLFVVHEYWRKGTLYPRDWTLRWYNVYDKLPEKLRKPVLIGECGRDRMGGIGGGWRTDGDDISNYLNELDQYHTSLAGEYGKYVLGTAIFNVGDWPPPGNVWKDFELADRTEFRDWLISHRSYRVSGGHETPPANNGDSTVTKGNPFGYNVGPGFVSEATRLGWTLLSDEIYHNPSNKNEAAGRTAMSEAFCDKGRLYFHAKTGVINVPFEQPPDHK